MLDGLFMLFILSIVMALASFLAGALPLSVALSSSQLRLISTIGMGVLVGTSLIVIIPEGIEAIYSVGFTHNQHETRHFPIQSHSPMVRWAPSGINDMIRNDVALPQCVTSANDLLESRVESSQDTVHVDSKPLPTGVTLTSPGITHGDDALSEQRATQPEQSAPTFYVGLSLITGFVLMFLIDKLPRHASDNLQPIQPPRHISLNNLSQGLHSNEADVEDEVTESFLQSLTPTPKQSRSLSTTTGLVIHAAADGIAMGASATSSNTTLGFVIFLAIMVHKAPAAFGLTSVLLKQGLSKRAARGHLIVFSLAAPFGALTTWLLVHLLGGKGFDGEHGQWWTGMLLLFSGGTFIYVAMHAMQEDPSHDHAAPGNYTETSQQRKQPRPQMRDTFAAVAGMLIPLVTQIGHHH